MFGLGFRVLGGQLQQGPSCPNAEAQASNLQPCNTASAMITPQMRVPWPGKTNAFLVETPTPSEKGDKDWVWGLGFGAWGLGFRV